MSTTNDTRDASEPLSEATAVGESDSATILAGVAPVATTGRKVSPLRTFRDLSPGETSDTFVVVAEVVSATARNGKPYTKLTVRDNHRSADCFVWSDNPLQNLARSLAAGDIIKVRGRLTVDDKWGAKLDADNMRLYDAARDSESVDLSALYPASRFDTARMWDELHAIVSQQIADQAVRAVVEAVLGTHGELFRVAPAANRNHHAVMGGLLEHTLSVARLAVHLADKYTDYYAPVGIALDKDLVVAGAVLHDVGKIVELDPRPGRGQYTTAGRLVGHILLGRDMLRQAAAQARPALDDQRLMLLEHIIIGHQGTREWGSPIEPRTLECLLVHHADNTDAKVNMVVNAILDESGSGEFTGRSNSLKAEFWRGRAASGQGPSGDCVNPSPTGEPL